MMRATDHEIVLAQGPHGAIHATLHREVDGEWELWLFVDDPDDLHIIKLAPEAQERLTTLHAYLLADENPPSTDQEFMGLRLYKIGGGQ